MRKFAKYILIFWLIFFTLISTMEVTRYVVTDGPKIEGAPKDVILFFSTFISTVVHLTRISKPLVIRSSTSLKNGFNRTTNYKESNDYLLVACWDDKYNQSIAKLVRICDGMVIHKWIPNIALLNKVTNSLHTVSLFRNNTRIQHPYLMNDGSLIFQAGSLFKIDKLSNILWSTKVHIHHSIEPDSDGNIWTCSYNSATMNSEKYHISDDVILKVSVTTGKIIFEKSVFEILMENGYERGIFFINPGIPSRTKHNDCSHLNDVQPVLEDSKYWKKGDLFLSLRSQNLVLLYRPSNNKIIWQKSGPWLKQHDIDVIDSTHIGIFGNNAFDVKVSYNTERLINGYNTQYVYDFSKNACTTPYDSFFKTAKISTYTQGLSRILNNGDIFVEETDNGRIIFGNHTEEIWSYIERIDKNHISILNWSRYITEEEFKKFTFIDQNNN